MLAEEDTLEQRKLCRLERGIDLLMTLDVVTFPLYILCYVILQ